MSSDLEKKKAVYSLQSLYQKNSTFWIKALQVKNDTIEILEENTQKFFKSKNMKGLSKHKIKKP